MAQSRGTRGPLPSTHGWPYQPVPVAGGQVEGPDDVDPHQTLLGLAGGQLLEVTRWRGHPGVLGQGVDTEKPLREPPGRAPWGVPTPALGSPRGCHPP